MSVITTMTIAQAAIIIKINKKNLLRTLMGLVVLFASANSRTGKASFSRNAHRGGTQRHESQSSQQCHGNHGALAVKEVASKEVCQAKDQADTQYQTTENASPMHRHGSAIMGTAPPQNKGKHGKSSEHEYRSPLTRTCGRCGFPQEILRLAPTFPRSSDPVR